MKHLEEYSLEELLNIEKCKECHIPLDFYNKVTFQQDGGTYIISNYCRKCLSSPSEG
jgi:hypothetical protein